MRTCDGYYFPISFSTVQSKFQDDERACQRMCLPLSRAVFPSQPRRGCLPAVSISGKSYTSLPNAFHYRQEFTSNCSCRRPGQSWAEALGSVDETIERGDIVVTDEKSRAMAAPKVEQPKAARQDGRKPKPDPNPSPPAPDSTASTAQAQTATVTDGGKRRIRPVGPQFLPVR